MHLEYSPHRKFSLREVVPADGLGIGQGFTDGVLQLAVQAVISMSPTTLSPTTSQLWRRPNPPR